MATKIEATEIELNGIKYVPASSVPAAATSPLGKPVVVTTAHRGVFFGYAENTDGETIKLSACRNCIYWDTGMKGFVGLASDGPSAACKVGPAANMELRNITAVLECTTKAMKAWESAPWAK